MAWLHPDLEASPSRNSQRSLLVKVDSLGLSCLVLLSCSNLSVINPCDRTVGAQSMLRSWRLTSFFWRFNFLAIAVGGRQNLVDVCHAVFQGSEKLPRFTWPLEAGTVSLAIRRLLSWRSSHGVPSRTIESFTACFKSGVQRCPVAAPRMSLMSLAANVLKMCPTRVFCKNVPPDCVFQVLCVWVRGLSQVCVAIRVSVAAR